MLTDSRIFIELFFSKIQNGGFIQVGGNLGKIFYEHNKEWPLNSK
jgi:hypothetical protein